MTYAAKDALAHDDIQLTHGGFILIGVLRGGDYSQGLANCGPAIAHGLAKCGFGDSLLQAARTLSPSALDAFLVGWREELRAELRTNSRGHLGRRCVALSKAIDESIPNVEVLLSYTNPVTSEEKGPGHKNTVVDWDKEPDLGRIAGLCEMYFEWGLKDIIIKRFRTVLWPSAVQRILRRAAILKDRRGALAARGAALDPVTPRKSGKARRAPPGTPSSMITKHFSTMALNTPHRGMGSQEGEDGEEDDEERLIVKIHSSRRHASTDSVLEYRLEIAPAQLVRLCEGGIKGLRTAIPPGLSDSGDGDDSDGKKGGKKTKKPPPEPESHLRMWMPACMVEIVEPELVEEFEDVQQKKADKKAGKGKSTRGGGTQKSKKPVAVAAVAEVEEESGSDADIPPPPPKPKTTKPSAISPSKGRSKTAASGPDSSQINAFFPAKKPTAAAAAPKATKAASSRHKGLDLFKDALIMDESTDDEWPAKSFPSRVSQRNAPSTTSTQRTTSANINLSRSGSSRILDALENISGRLSPSKRSVPGPPPPERRPLQPFPIDLSTFKLDGPSIDDNPFVATSNRVASSSSSQSFSGARTRTRSTLTASDDSDAPRETQLQKSPRRSEKHSSPRRSRQDKGKTRAAAYGALRQEEEESSDDARPPSPSPSKGKQALRALTPRAFDVDADNSSARGEEESDRAPSPSPVKHKLAPRPTAKPAASRPADVVRRPAALPADLSIISISSGSEDEAPPRAQAQKPAPLLIARAKAGLTGPAPRKPPPRMYDPDDVIDLT